MDDAARQTDIDRPRGSGAQGRIPEPRYLVTGRVVGAHGLHGELKVKILTEDPHRFQRLERVFLGPEGQEPVSRKVKDTRLHKGNLLLMIEGCDNRTSAEQLRGYVVQVPREEAIPLEEGAYFEHQIIGLEAWTVSGECLGSVTEIIATGANDVYVVRGGSSGRDEVLIPAIEGVLREVDLEAERLTVDLPDGLL